jgi:predicted carbohydrate-binding protein with CBM5 and CBM33 domain
MNKGDKIYFAEEKRPYTVRAISEKYAILTRWYNKKEGVVYYTIIDRTLNARSTNDYVFNPYDYNQQADIDQCMVDLQNEEAHLSERNKIELNILKIAKPNEKSSKVSQKIAQKLG